MKKIDHRAEAARLARDAETTVRRLYGQSVDAQVLATLAQVHAALAAEQPPADDPYWAQAKELEDLRAAVREALEDSEHDRPHEIDVHHLARLRELVKD